MIPYPYVNGIWYVTYETSYFIRTLMFTALGDILTCSYFRIRPRGRLNVSKLSGFDILIDNFEDRTQIEQKFDFLKGGIHMTK